MGVRTPRWGNQQTCRGRANGCSLRPDTRWPVPGTFRRARMTFPTASKPLRLCERIVDNCVVKVDSTNATGKPLKVDGAGNGLGKPGDEIEPDQKRTQGRRQWCTVGCPEPVTTMAEDHHAQDNQGSFVNAVVEVDHNHCCNCQPPKGSLFFTGLGSGAPPKPT